MHRTGNVVGKIPKHPKFLFFLRKKETLEFQYKYFYKSTAIAAMNKYENTPHWVYNWK